MVLTFDITTVPIQNYARTASVGRKVLVPKLDGVALPYSCPFPTGTSDAAAKTDVKATLTADGITWTSEA